VAWIATRYGLDGTGFVPSGGEIFHTRSHQPRGPSSLLYNGYEVSYPRVKRPGRGPDHPPPLDPGSGMGRAVRVPTLHACLACNEIALLLYFGIHIETERAG
jgi:hypothetical protein